MVVYLRGDSLVAQLVKISICNAGDPGSILGKIPWSLLKLMPTESVMPSNHLILCRPLLLPPSIFLSRLQLFETTGEI